MRMKYYCLLYVLFAQVLYAHACIKLLNRGWKKMTPEKRARNASLVVTARILSTKQKLPKSIFYSATFEVINVLKGWDLLKKLHQTNSTTLKSLQPHIVASANGFGDSRFCFSPVQKGESYVLFLGYKEDTDSLIAKYDDLFGAAERPYQRTERAILATLGWEEWSGWNRCSVNCGGGSQRRTRSCRKSTQNSSACVGPSVEKRHCNSFSCKDSFDVLTFILNQRKDHFSQWEPHDDQIFKNSINQPSPAKAPTYLLLSNFPRESILHLSFKGPVRDTQFLHSIYDANNRMELGIKVSRYAFMFSYDKKIDTATKFRKTVSYTFNFSENIWYTLAISLSNDKVSFKINCGVEHSAIINTNLTENLDVYGQMYLGASSESEKEKSRVRVEMGSIMISKDLNSYSKQCGSLFVDSESSEVNGETMEGSGRPGLLRGPDDSESGDVDEEYGSGEGLVKKVKVCQCKNGGICKENDKCFCARGWSGPLCTIPICNNKCLNGGKCVAPNVCKCKQSTSGSYCQFNECQLPCQNSGDCIGFNKCRCKKGFSGPQCQYESCSKRCLNGGQCLKNGQCLCAKGFKGEQCQHPENCKEFITKLVRHVKPATQILYYKENGPCEDDKTKKCLLTKSKSVNIETIDFRETYVCKTEVI